LGETIVLFPDDSRWVDCLQTLRIPCLLSLT
jgi:hypothetical protein